MSIRRYALSTAVVFVAAVLLSAHISGTPVWGNIGSGNGDLLKRPPEETCQGCHRTDQNTPAPGDAGYAQSIWDNAIKTHSSDFLGACAGASGASKRECTNNGGTWTPDKWAPNGWGVSGGQYGAFLCTTCHTAHDTKNIYLIKDIIAAPNSPINDFPASADIGCSVPGPATQAACLAAGGTWFNVDFRIKSGTPGITPGMMGDDSRLDPTTSTNVCEVCHSQTNYHKYNQGSDSGHHNGENCAICHDHKGAFKPNCNGCHGNPPQLNTSGESGLVFDPKATGSQYGVTHIKHATGGGNYNFSCYVCHTGGMTDKSQQDYKIELGFNLFNGAYSGNGTTYTGQPLINNYSYNFTNGTTQGTTEFECTNIYCHGATMNVNGDMNGGTSITPRWNDDPNNPTTAACGACHGVTSANPPQRGSHPMHAGNISTKISSLACVTCHSATVDKTNVIIDRTKHVNNAADWAFDQTDNRVVGATYNGLSSGSETMPQGFPRNNYGVCTNLYCHSNANPAPNADPLRNVPNEFKTPMWGGAGTQADCQANGGNWDSTNQSCTGIMKCYSCHKGRSSNPLLPVAQTDDNTQANCAAISGNWDIYCATTQSLCCVQGGGTWDSTSNSCTSSSFTWTGGVCRGGGLTQTLCESTQSGGLSGRWVQVCDNSQTDLTPLLTMNSNGHYRLVNPEWIRKYPCIYCHADTADVNGNIVDKTKHVNGSKDIRVHTTQAVAQGIKNWGIQGLADPSYDPSTKVCSNIYCHSDGRENINQTIVTPAPWNGGSMKCNSCHGHPQGSCSTGGCHDGGTVQSNGQVLPTLCSSITQSVCESNGGTWSGVFCQGLTGGPGDPTGGTLCGSLGGKVDWPAGDEWMAAAPMFPNGGPGSGSENSHPRHIQSNFVCSTCHYKTVSNGVCTNCHSAGENLSGSMGEAAHVNPAYHVNKVPDIYFDPSLADPNQQGYLYYNGRNGTGIQDPSKRPKSCTNPCHTSPSSGPMNPAWGGTLSDSYAFCKGCHGSDHDTDYYGNFTGDPSKRPTINLSEWTSTGHGRSAINNDVYANPYPVSQNPAANFESAPNPCWYCHDNTVLHTDPTNPFRLKKHPQFRSRFEKECVYCHMEGLDSECLSCHNVTPTCDNSSGTACSTNSQCPPGGTCEVESLAPQLSNIGPGQKYCKTTWADGSAATSPCVDHTSFTDGLTSCTTASCHFMNPVYQPDANTPYSDYKRHNTGSGLWTSDQKADVENQYVWMGVCLKCHDDDSGGQCTSCHQAPASDPNRYSLGYDGGQGSICSLQPNNTPISCTKDADCISQNAGTCYFKTAHKAKASSFHFGYKHYNYFIDSGGWTLGTCSDANYINKSSCEASGGKWTATTDGSGYRAGTTRGGKFCWDCHDPHGDQNIYMIHSRPSGASDGGVATSTDGVYGKPLTRAAVVFKTKTYNPKSPWGYYAVSTPDPATGTYDGICNVCHQSLTDGTGKVLVEAKHWTNTGGDGHNNGKVCTSCHQHRFNDSHASGLACNTCHMNKPVPRHTGFSLPRDCTKCHIGIGKRIDIMGQMQGNSHHVQGITVTNRTCYICHWEATPLGLIDSNYHLGYNYKTHVSTPGSVADLVVWGPGTRPINYVNGGACSGSDPNCSSFNNQPACTADTNCQWTPPSAATLANGGYCSGGQNNYCSNSHQDEQSCAADTANGCQWTQLTAMTFNALFVGSDNYTCTIPGIADQNTCTASYACSNSSYATQTDCNAAYYGWVSGVWGTERDEVEKVTPHCLGCHSSQNKDTKPFSYCSIPVNPNTGSYYLTQYDACSISGYSDQTSCTTAGGQWLTGCLNPNNPYYCSKAGYNDQASCESAQYCTIAGYDDQTHCQNAGGQWVNGVWSQPTWISDCKVPRQYAWDKKSIADRYLQTGTTTWGKYVNIAHALIMPMDETSWNGTSGEVKDKSPNGNNGTAYGGANTVEWGKFERAGSFNGANYVTVNNSASLNPASITITAWVYISSAPAASGNIVSKGDNSGYRFRISNNGTVAWFDRGCGSNGVGSCISSKGLISLNAWTLIAVTGDSTGLKIYINGVLDNSNSVPYSSPSTTNALYIGADPAFGEYFNGLIDDVVIYSSSLSAPQIQTLAQGTVEYLGCDTGVCTTSPRNFTKAFSAHGNAKSNQGGWDSTGGTGLDNDLSGKNMRAATRNVQCFDCHSSHGSKLVGNTSSYITTYGPSKCNSTVDNFKICASNADCSAGVACTSVGHWGGNLKETVANRGGYSMDYTASYNPNTTGVNPYAAGAGQCFDCHETRNAVRPSCSGSGTCSTHTDQTSCQSDVNNCIWSSKGIPWGYSETFGVANPIMGYKDTSRFGQGVKASQSRFTYRANKNTIVGGHLHASSSLITPAQQSINGLCTYCHDPHGVSPILGTNQAYGVPLLKGTWLTSPYKEDSPSMSSGVQGSRSNEYPSTSALQTVHIDQNTFNNGSISETDSQFAGLCLNCHPKANLTDGVTHTWRDKNRIHESVKGWKTADATIQHNYPCSKCHQPHDSGLPRLLQTNCLDYNHRGQVASGGQPSSGAGSYDNGSFPKGSNKNYQSNCHPTPEGWPNNYWNIKSPW